MPPDTDARVVLRAKDLLYFQSRSPVGFYFLYQGHEPFRNFFGLLKLLQCVVIFEAERCDTPLAFERAELEWDQGKFAYPLDKIMLYGASNEFGKYRRPFGPMASTENSENC